MTDPSDRKTEPFEIDSKSIENGRKSRNLLEGVREIDSRPGLVASAKLLRRLLPGDERYSDALSTAGGELPQHLGRRLAELRPQRPSATRELGLDSSILAFGRKRKLKASGAPRELVVCSVKARRSAVHPA